ncbi:MAG: hypothetical protein RBJ76_13400 [Stenomitos frigidus ULC029]
MSNKRPARIMINKLPPYYAKWVCILAAIEADSVPRTITEAVKGYIDDRKTVIEQKAREVADLQGLTLEEYVTQVLSTREALKLCELDAGEEDGD